MASLISFAYLLVAAICVSGKLRIPDFEGRRFLKYPHEFPTWERKICGHDLKPYVYERDHYDFSNEVYDIEPSRVSKEATSTANAEKLGSMKVRRKYPSTAVTPRRVGYTWRKEDDMSGHPQGLRYPVFRSRLDEVSVHTDAVTPDFDERIVVLKKISRVQPLKEKVVQDELAAKGTGGERNSTSIGSNEEAGYPESSVEANENGTSEEEVKTEATDPSTAEETGTTEAVPESSRVEDTTTPSVSDKVDDGISETSFPATTVTVKETVVTVYSTVDHSFPKELSPSATTPSTAVTDSETVSLSPSTAGESSSKGISPSNTPLPSSAGTASETASSTPSAAGDSSSEGILPSKTPLPSSVVTAIETVPSTPSAGDRSSKIVFPSKTPLSSSTVTVSETVSSTPSTAGDSSSKGGASTSPAIPITERVIVLPRVRSARIVLSSVLLAIGLVAVAVAAVCIFRERRRKLKYDQLKLLP